MAEIGAASDVEVEAEPVGAEVRTIPRDHTKTDLDVSFRRAREGDSELLLGIVERSLEPYGLRVDPHGIDRVLTEIGARFPEKAVDGHDRAQMWVIEIGEAGGRSAVGCGGFQPWEARAGAATAATCELFKMYLEPAWKGRGLGRLLLAWLEERAAGAGYARVWLETHAVLREADAMYRRHGYAPTDEGHVCTRCTHQLMKVLPS